VKRVFSFFAYLAAIIIAVFEVYYLYSSTELVLDSSLSSQGKTLNLVILVLEILGTLYIAILYWHIARAWRYKKPRLIEKLPTPAPMVNIIIPTYNEPFRIVKDTFDAAISQQYPLDRFRVIVADDSPQPIANLKKYVESKRGIYHRRTNRKGFKGGAINEVIRTYPADYFAIFDSDHVSKPDFLQNTVKLAIQDPKIFLVQERANFVNTGSWMRKASAFIHSQFFGIFQRSRHLSRTPIFAGTTGLLNQEILLKEGGILEDTIAEDTDTSIYLATKGYKGVFYDKIGTDGLVPWDPISGVRQIWRWNNGLTKSFRLRAKNVLFSKELPVFSKIDFLVTLFLPTLGVMLWLMNFILLYMLGVSIPIIRPGASNLANSFLFLVAPTLVSLSTIFMGVSALLIDAEVQTKYHQLPLIKKVIGITLFSLYSMAIQPFMLSAVIKGLFGSKTIFNRTPKSPKQSTQTPTKIKYKYAAGAIVLFLISLVFFYATYITFITKDPRIGWFSITAITSAIPMIFVITGFKGLEKFIEEHSTISVKDLLEREK